MSGFTYAHSVYNDCGKEQFILGSSKWKGFNKRICGLVVRFNILFVMAASSTNDVIELLEKLLKILKEEQVFDQSGDRPVIQFLHPKDLQVNSNLFSYVNNHFSSILIHFCLNYLPAFLYILTSHYYGNVIFLLLAYYFLALNSIVIIL